MRPIDADEVFRIRDEECYDCKSLEPCFDCVINRIPTLDYVPVVHGRWVSEKVRKPNWKGVEHDYFQPNSCSVCHTGFAFRTNFCPNCGARMYVTDTNVGYKGGSDK